MLKQLEEENRQLKKIGADLALNIEAQKIAAEGKAVRSFGRLLVRRLGARPNSCAQTHST
jgi:hypothetical protein